MMFSSINKKSIVTSGKPKLKNGVDYKGRNSNSVIAKDWTDKNGDLIYYSYEYYSITKEKFVEEYSYNPLVKRVDYRNSNGTRWEKLYNKNGFEIILTHKKKKHYYCLTFDTMKIVHCNQKKEMDEKQYDVKDKFVIDGIDYEDRFMIENSDLVKYLTLDITTNELFKRVNIYGTEFLDRASKVQVV